MTRPVVIVGITMILLAQASSVLGEDEVVVWHCAISGVPAGGIETAGATAAGYCVVSEPINFTLTSSISLSSGAGNTCGPHDGSLGFGMTSCDVPVGPATPGFHTATFVLSISAGIWTPSCSDPFVVCETTIPYVVETTNLS